MGLVDPELQSLHPETASHALNNCWDYVQLDAGLSTRGTDSLLDYEIKAYVKDEIYLH